MMLYSKPELHRLLINQGRIQDFWKGGGANLRQQSLGWRCTPSMRSMVELGGSGGMPPPKILKIDAKILKFRGISTHYTT